MTVAIDSVFADVYTDCFAEHEDGDNVVYHLMQDVNTSYNNKLWYQMTVHLYELYDLPIATKKFKRSIYDKFVIEFGLWKLNPLDIVNFFVKSTFDEDNNWKSDFEDLKSLLDEFQKKIDSKRENEPIRNIIDYIHATIMIKLEMSRHQIKLGDLTDGKDYLNQFESQYIDNKTEEVPLFIINRFYKVNALYFEGKNDYNSFYTTTLLYLSTLDPNDESLENIDEIAYKMCVAAIKGDKIFNFGELLQHPILKTVLQDVETPKLQYVLNILVSLSQGDFNKFNEVVAIQDSDFKIDETTLLFLKQKIRIMTLIELIFTANLRILSFQQIADATRLQDNIGDVEHLVMKSISLGLLKGSIDQVNQLVTITWVQPRIINLTQIAKMNHKLISWDQDVKNLADRMDNYGQSMWV